MAIDDVSANRTPETPLEQAMRAEVEKEKREGGRSEDERDADIAVEDVAEYIAETDPSALAEAEEQLNAWEVPASPFDNLSDKAVGISGQPSLENIFSARTESEANIVKGLLESEGIAAIFREVATPTYGSIFSAGESRWADILVATSDATAARAAIENAVSTAKSDNASISSRDAMPDPEA